ncbi:MAG: DUF885 domain-containing protein [Opitutus sp.]
MKKLIVLLVAFVLISAPVRAATASFDAWADSFSAQWVRLNPLLATRTQYFPGNEQDEMDRQLALVGGFGNFYGAKASRSAAVLAQRGLDELSQFPTANLTPIQRTSAAVIKATLEDTVANAEFAQYQLVFEQIGGFHLGLVDFLTNTHPVRNRRDVENYLVRLSRIAGIVDAAIAESKAAAAAGIVAPRFILQRVIEQIDGFVATPPSDNVFVSSLGTRLAPLSDALPEKDRTAFVAAAGAEVRRTVLPAYQRIRDALTEQLPLAKDDAGLWRFPQGALAYRRALQSSTTTSLTPDEIHAIGLREVARLEAEMATIFQQLGIPEGSTQERVEKLNVRLLLPANPDPRPILLETVKHVVADAEQRSASAFDLRPKASVTVKREPAFSEESSAAHYTDPAPDGSIPGIYWIPLADLSPRVTWLGASLKSTAYHEAIPGHHFQISIQQEAKDLPRYRKLGIFGANNAYIEGWALYAERLAAENGWYEGDLPGKLGYLNLQLFRARRLVADTGLHAQKWTRQQAIDYGFTPQEVERYIVWPGQACSYMIGQLRIMELRERARAALGANFSIKEFHNVVLRGGSLPLDVLGQEVDAWIAKAKSASK